VRLFRVRVEVEELFENIEPRDIEVGSGGRATEEYSHCVHAESVWWMGEVDVRKEVACKGMGEVARGIKQEVSVLIRMEIVSERV
jgi:hypothetical protein